MSFGGWRRIFYCLLFGISVFLIFLKGTCVALIIRKKTSNKSCFYKSQVTEHMLPGGLLRSTATLSGCQSTNCYRWSTLVILSCSQGQGIHPECDSAPCTACMDGYTTHSAVLNHTHSLSAWSSQYPCHLLLHKESLILSSFWVGPAHFLNLVQPR